MSLLFFLSFFFWLENDSKGIFDGFGSKIVSAIVFGDVKKIRVSVCVRVSACVRACECMCVSGCACEKVQERK